MTVRSCVRAVVPSLIAGVVVIGCASAPKPSIATITVAASPDSNPDAQGRPQPVVVRVYQLKENVAFNGADFFALYDDEQKVLGPALVSRSEYMLKPSEKRSLELEVSPDARFVAAVAAFRDIRNAKWRAVVAVTDDDETVTVGVERDQILLSVAD
jgi:type VI secretion system protein VasD